jgi:hypothetical protein
MHPSIDSLEVNKKFCRDSISGCIKTEMAKCMHSRLIGKEKWKCFNQESASKEEEVEWRSFHFEGNN